MTLSEENYLKAVYHLEEEHPKGVPTNAIAERMETKAPSATDMIKRLAKKKLTEYEPYQGVKLTPKGQSIALKVIRKHRLWEYFLVKKLNFNWDEVHDIAEQLEHIQSEELTNRLDEFLAYPKTDPHGDLIPDKEGNLPKIDKILLSECKPKKRGIVVGVNDSSQDFLQYLDKQKIKIGATVKVIDKEDFDHSMNVEINSKSIWITPKTASNLYIELKED